MMDAAKEPIANIINPPTRSIGKFFGDTLDFWFSNRELKYAKKQIMDELALRKFREECEAEFAKIPEEELVPPRKALLLPALDAAEYYVEEEELRRMFARLVAATFDIRKASEAHPSFKEIIQQLSPLDAQNLAYINKETVVPIVLEQSCNQMIFIRHDESFDENLIDLNFLSIDLLRHLGLVELLEGTVSLSYKDKTSIVGATMDYSRYYSKSFIKYSGFSSTGINNLKKEILSLTELGCCFCSVCLPNPWEATS